MVTDPRCAGCAKAVQPGQTLCSSCAMKFPTGTTPRVGASRHKAKRTAVKAPTAAPLHCRRCHGAIDACATKCQHYREWLDLKAMRKAQKIAKDRAFNLLGRRHLSER